MIEGLRLFQGVLIEYVARADDATFHLETWIFPHVKYMPPFEKPNHRLTVSIVTLSLKPLSFILPLYDWTVESITSCAPSTGY